MTDHRLTIVHRSTLDRRHYWQLFTVERQASDQSDSHRFRPVRGRFDGIRGHSMASFQPRHSPSGRAPCGRNRGPSTGLYGAPLGAGKHCPPPGRPRRRPSFSSSNGLQERTPPLSHPLNGPLKRDPSSFSSSQWSLKKGPPLFLILLMGFKKDPPLSHPSNGLRRRTPPPLSHPLISLFFF